GPGEPAERWDRLGSVGLVADLVPPDAEVGDDDLADGLFLAVLLVGVGAELEVAGDLDLVALAGPEGETLPIDAGDPDEGLVVVAAGGDAEGEEVDLGLGPGALFRAVNDRVVDVLGVGLGLEGALG